MKKICMLLSALSLSIACANSMAHTSTARVKPVQNCQEKKFHGEIPNYYALPPGVDLLKNAVSNPDGSKTIKAGQQTPEANELNCNYCKSLGGTDMTNERDQLIGAGTLYAVVCKGPVSQSPSVNTQVLPGKNRNPFSKN